MPRQSPKRRKRRGLQQSPHAREKASKTDKFEKKSGSGEENTKKTTKRKAKGKEDADAETGDPFVSSEHSESTGGESGETCGGE